MSGTFVLFDFDGVIADSYALAYDVARHMHPHLTEEDYRALFDGNIYEMGSKLVCGPECKRTQAEYFRLFSSRRGEVQIVPGMREAVMTLSEAHTLCIISSSISMDIMAFLERFEIAEYFSDVLGSDVHTSKVEKINTVLSRYEVMMRDGVFITDTLGDMREAEQSGIGAIGVAWGFQDTERLARGNPFRVVATPAELPRAVDEYFARRA